MRMISGEEIAIKTAFSISTLTGVTGNILVCLVVLLNKSMRTPMNYLLVNLAVSDLMLLIFFSPAFIFRGFFTHPGGLTGDILCALITGETLAWIGGYASSVFLLAISIERYIAVANPHKYGTSFITRNLKLLVAACWLFTLAWNAIGFEWKRFDSTTGFCTMTWTLSSFKIYSILCFLVLGVVPMTTMAVLYSKIIYILWFKDLVMNLDEERQQKKRKKATKMVLTVSLIYALSWFPELTIFVLSAYAPQSFRGDIAYPATVAICSFNAAVNPIIYSFHSSVFRRHLKKIVCRCCFKDGTESSMTAGSSTGLQIVREIPFVSRTE